MKTLTYSIMHFLVAFTVSYLLTGNIAIASSIALIEPAVQTVAYYLHEKAWYNYSANKNNYSIRKEEYKFNFSHLFLHAHKQ